MHPTKRGVALDTFSEEDSPKSRHAVDSALLCDSVKSDGATKHMCKTAAEAEKRSGRPGAGLCPLFLAACVDSGASDAAESASASASASDSPFTAHSDKSPNTCALNEREMRESKSSVHSGSGLSGAAGDKCGDASPIAHVETALGGSDSRRRRQCAEEDKSLSVASVAYLLLAANCLHTFVRAHYTACVTYTVF